MLELKINKKDISLDPFKIVAWEDQELAMALFASKPVGEGKKRVHSRLRILIGEEKAVLARIRGEEAALQKARVMVYTLGGLSKEFCRQFALVGKRVFHVGSMAYSELAEDIRQRQGYEMCIRDRLKADVGRIGGLLKMTIRPNEGQRTLRPAEWEELLHAARQVERMAKRLAALEVKITDGYRQA